MRRRCSTPGGVMLGVDMVGLWVEECIMGATMTGQYRDVDLARLSLLFVRAISTCSAIQKR